MQRKDVLTMPRTANVFARIEPELKEDSESILAQLGIPMSNAIGLFLRQVVLQRGLPFEVKLPERKKPIALKTLNADKFDKEINKGYADMKAGRVRSAKNVFDDMLDNASIEEKE